MDPRTSLDGYRKSPHSSAIRSPDRSFRSELKNLYIFFNIVCVLLKISNRLSDEIAKVVL